MIHALACSCGRVYLSPRFRKRPDVFCHQAFNLLLRQWFAGVLVKAAQVLGDRTLWFLLCILPLLCLWNSIRCAAHRESCRQPPFAAILTGSSMTRRSPLLLLRSEQTDRVVQEYPALKSWICTQLHQERSLSQFQFFDLTNSIDATIASDVSLNL